MGYKNGKKSYFSFGVTAFHFIDKAKDQVHRQKIRQNVHCSKNKEKRHLFTVQKNREKSDRNAFWNLIETKRYPKNTTPNSKGDKYLLSSYMDIKLKFNLLSDFNGMSTRLVLFYPWR